MPAKKKKDRPDDVSAYIRRRLAADSALASAVEVESARLELARRVRQLRVRRQLTQGELAELAGTKQPNIARLESGRAGPTLGFLEKVASALGAKLDVRLRG